MIIWWYMIYSLEMIDCLKWLSDLASVTLWRLNASIVVSTQKLHADRFMFCTYACGFCESHVSGIWSFDEVEQHLAPILRISYRISILGQLARAPRRRLRFVRSWELRKAPGGDNFVVDVAALAAEVGGGGLGGDSRVAPREKTWKQLEDAKAMVATWQGFSILSFWGDRNHIIANQKQRPLNL